VNPLPLYDKSPIVLGELYSNDQWFTDVRDVSIRVYNINTGRNPEKGSCGYVHRLSSHTLTNFFAHIHIHDDSSRKLPPSLEDSMR
jgi:hypothetical protein